MQYLINHFVNFNYKCMNMEQKEHGQTDKRENSTPTCMKHRVKYAKQPAQCIAQL